MGKGSMTRVKTNKKFRDNWDAAFGKKEDKKKTLERKKRRKDKKR